MNEIRLEPGELIQVSGTEYEIVSLTSSSKVRAKSLLDGSIKTFPLSKIEAPGKSKEKLIPPFDALSEKQQKISKERYDILKGLLDAPHGKKTAKAKALAKEHSVSVRTLYDWYFRFQSTGKVSSLIDKRGTRGSHRSRLSKKQLSIINRVAEEYYETPQKPSVQRAIEQVQIACKEERVAFPSDRSIRRHINNRDLYRATAKREGAQIARNRYGTVYGKSHQEINQPLALVQMDHTTLDIELVHDVSRLPVGRPALTIALDVFSRVIMGIFVSFENVSLLTAGLCLEHAMFPKNDWLLKYKIKNDWPIWGKPICLHVDNAMEFRSRGLDDFCKEYDVRLEYRPVGKPHYGGHVERVIKTINEEIKKIPGATFSNIKEKGNYDSEKNATMTLYAFQCWLGEFITGKYLKKVHSSLGISPLKKWEQGTKGTKYRIGVGKPPILADREDICTTLLPTYKRSLTREGIVIDYIYYSTVELHAFRHQRLNKKDRSKVTVKRDPRDISRIYVLDKERRRWLEVSYRNDTNPSVSLSDWQAALRETKKENRNENEIFATHYKRSNEIVEQEKKATKKQRRMDQRRRNLKKDETLQKDSKSLHLFKNKKTTPKKVLPTEEVECYKDEFS